MLPGLPAFAVSYTQPFVDLWHKIVDMGPKWIVAIVFVVVAWLLARVARKLTQKAISRTSTQGHIDILVSRGVSGLIIAAGIILALSALGMSLSAALAAVGLASVGIGFALQDILSNFFAGVVLLIQHPFTVGDQVKIGDEEGMVENIKVRDTQLLTYEGERIFIPNKTVFTNPIINYTATPSQRMDVPIGIKHVEDIDRARKLARKATRSIGGVLDQPEPSVLVDQEDEVVVLILRFWIESDRNRADRIRSEVVESVATSFRTEGIATFHAVLEQESGPGQDPGPDDGDTMPMDAIS